MIQGLHGIFHTPEPEAARDFIRDKLGFAHVDAGDGWLIFGVPLAEIAVHPGEDTHHQLSFWCDDIEQTMKSLRKKGVEFTSPLKEERWGRITTLVMPGGVEVMLYEPRHAQP